MLSESARAASSAEARFRLQAPNSLRRRTTVVALDRPGEAVLRELAQGSWNQATFLKAPIVDGDGPADGWVTDLGERRTRLREHVDASDQVIMLAGAGGHADAAAIVGRACSLKRVTTTALIVGAGNSPDADLAKTLAQLRPWSLMVVIANSDDYISDMMTALRV